MAVSLVRELAVPDRLGISVEDRFGYATRWALDEVDAGDRPLELAISSALPGGDRDVSCRLLREHADTADLGELNPVKVYGPGVESVFEGSLAKAPSGDRSVSPAAIGRASELKGDPSLAMVVVDRDPGNWTPDTATAKLINLAAGYSPTDGSVDSDPIGTSAGLALEWQGDWIATSKPCVTMIYDGGAAKIGQVYCVWSGYGAVGSGSPFAHRLYASDSDNPGSYTPLAYNGGAYSLPGTVNVPLSTPRRFIIAQLRYDAGPAGSPNLQSGVHLGDLAVYGDNSIPLVNRHTGPPGVLGRDVIAEVLDRTPTSITYTDDSLEEDDFVIPHLEWRDPVTAEAAILDTNRYFRKLWGVYGGVFYWRDLETFGRTWRVRKSDGARPQSSGFDVEHVWNGVVVRYNDPSTGRVEVVGPPGSNLYGPLGLSTVDLLDWDEENPANAHNQRKWAVIDAGMTTEDGAIRLGAYFLRTLKDRRSSGSIDLRSGWVLNEAGIAHPAWAVRAGDRLIVEDDSPRPHYIVEATYNHDSRTVSCSLDAPPDTLESILERLQVVLVGRV